MNTYYIYVGDASVKDCNQLYEHIRDFDIEIDSHQHLVSETIRCTPEDMTIIKIKFPKFEIRQTLKSFEKFRE